MDDVLKEAKEALAAQGNRPDWAFGTLRFSEIRALIDLAKGKDGRDMRARHMQPPPPPRQIAPGHATTTPEQEQEGFDKWWAGSKYCLVVNPQNEWRQIALDSFKAGLKMGRAA